MLFLMEELIVLMCWFIRNDPANPIDNISQFHVPSCVASAGLTSDFGRVNAFTDKVSVPCSSLFKTVTVRCGHCTNLLSVNMRGLLLPAAANQLHLGHAFLPPLPPPHHNLSLLDEIACPLLSFLMDPPNLHANANLM